MLAQREEIHRLNRQYLLIAQGLARSDIDLASDVTGISKKALTQIAELTVMDIDALHDDLNYLIFKPRLSENDLQRLLSLPSGARGAYMSSINKPRG